MGPSETIEFFGKQVERSEKGILTAKLAGNYQLLAFNGRQVFKSRLMQGLILWRHGNNPRPPIESAVNTTQDVMGDLLALNPLANIEMDLPLSAAAILGFLIDRPFGLEQSISNLLEPNLCLDSLLASHLNGNLFTAEIKEELNKLNLQKGCGLAARTYQTYFEIIDQAKERNSITDLIGQAENLFLLRAKDGFYSGGEQTEGGGPDNKIVVDYRLAAVLKQVNHIEESIHRWRW